MTPERHTGTSEPGSLPVALERVLSLARRTLGADAAVLTEVEDGRLARRVAIGVTARRPDAEPDAALSGRVATTGQPVIEPDAPGDASSPDVRAYLGVPVRIDGAAVRGVLCATSLQPRAWSASDLATLQDLAALAGTALSREAQTRQVQREAALYATMFKASPDAVLVLEPTTERVLDANAAACVLYGRRREDLVGSSMKDISVDAAAGEAVMERLLAEGGTMSFESVQRRRDGTPIDIAISASVVRTGDRVYVLSVNRDITDLLQAQRLLSTSEARFRLIAEALPQMVFTTDAAGRTTFRNARWLAYSGLAPDDPDGAWVHTLHPDDRERCVALLQHCIGTGEPYEAECRLREAATGVYRWFIARAEPLPDAHGAFTQWFGTFTDIHDVREAQERLRDSTERLRLAHLATSDVVWDWDAESRTVSWSPAFHSVLGWDDGIVRAQAWCTAQIHPDDRDRVAASFQKALAGTGTVWQNEYRFARADGTYAYVLDRAHMLRDGQGRVRRAVGALVDLTARRALETEAVAARQAAEAANRVKSALLANMSHEIRTPLTAILGYAEILASEVQDDLRDMVAIVRRGGVRLLETLNTVMDLAQIEGGAFAIAAEPVDLLKEACAACEAIAPAAEAKGLGIEVCGTGAHALADPMAVGRVLHHLVGNAVKFTSAGSVRVEVASDGVRAGLRVSDTGVGIAPEFLPDLFDAFTQESEGHSRAFEGSGLGLAVSHRLVRLMGGTIAVESQKDAGSVFTVWLPAAEPARAPADARVREAA